MQTLSVVGADPDLRAVASRLDGPTATVTRDAVDTPTAVDTTVTLSSDGSRLSRAADDLPSVLDRLAPDHDHALIAGDSTLRLPTVVVGEADPAGDVVERIPSGETVAPERLAALVRDVEPYVTLSSLVAEAKAADGAERSGAIATFTGRVRARDGPDDEPTTRLAFDRYDAVAAERLATIESELADREGVFGVWTHHRVGVIPAGEDIVFVVVLAGHRTEAFATVSDGIDRLKREVPIFKRETTVSETFWTHERE